MKNLLDKSDENYSSFILLKDAGNLCSCVHCAYYSAFQLTMYALTESYGYSLDFLVGRNSNSHKTVKNEFCKLIKTKVDMFTYKYEMEKLTKERVSADYKDKEYGLKEISKIERSLNIVRTLINNNS